MKEQGSEGIGQPATAPFEENHSSTPGSSSSRPPPVYGGVPNQSSSSIKVRTKFDSKKKEVRVQGEVSGGDAPAGPPQPVNEDPQPRIPVAPQVYQMPSGRTVRLRPRGEDEEAARPSKTQ